MNSGPGKCPHPQWRKRLLNSSKYHYVYIDGIYLRRNWGDEFENVAIPVAIAVNEDGYREVLGAAEQDNRRLQLYHREWFAADPILLAEKEFPEGGEEEKSWAP